MMRLAGCTLQGVVAFDWDHFRGWVAKVEHERDAGWILDWEMQEIPSMHMWKSYDLLVSLSGGSLLFFLRSSSLYYQSRGGDWVARTFISRRMVQGLLPARQRIRIYFKCSVFCFSGLRVCRLPAPDNHVRISIINFLPPSSVFRTTRDSTQALRRSKFCRTSLGTQRCGST